MPPLLSLIGYAAWPAPTRARRLVEALRANDITRLVDVRLNPCSSGLDAAGPYGPKPWNLQAGDAGIVGLLGAANIAYTWLVELGNPQRHDPAMTVLRGHLADPSASWPVHRGLDRLAGLIRAEPGTIALLCACRDGRSCHRRVIADALRDRHFAGSLTLRDFGPVARRNRGDSAAST